MATRKPAFGGKKAVPFSKGAKKAPKTTKGKKPFGSDGEKKKY